MSLLTTLRAGIAIADAQTQSLQATVMFSKYGGSDEYGDPVYGAPVKLFAIVDWKQRQVRTQAGILSVSRASVLFLDIKELNAATHGEGVDDMDKIVLPDGTTGPILDMGGFVDAGTNLPMTTEVFLG
jgi:hypothetical protein